MDNGIAKSAAKRLTRAGVVEYDRKGAAGCTRGRSIFRIVLAVDQVIVFCGESKQHRDKTR